MGMNRGTLRPMPLRQKLGLACPGIYKKELTIKGVTHRPLARGISAYVPVFPLIQDVQRPIRKSDIGNAVRLLEHIIVLRPDSEHRLVVSPPHLVCHPLIVRLLVERPIA